MTPVFPRAAAVVTAALLAAGAAHADDGWLGVQLQGLAPETTETTDGVRVGDVVDGSPAQKAGLKDGDVIVGFEGAPVVEIKDLTKAVRKADPGDEVTVTVLRDGERQDIPVTLGERDRAKVLVWSDREVDDDAVPAPEHHVFAYFSGVYLGIGMQDLTEQLGEVFGVDDGQGVLVSEVKDDSPAAAAGLKAGDVIVKVGDEPVADTGDLRGALADLEPGDAVAIEIIRQGARSTVRASLAEPPAGDGPGHMWGTDFRFEELPRLREFLPQAERWREMGRSLRDERSRADEEMSELRDELQQMRRELEELRRDLNDR